MRQTDQTTFRTTHPWIDFRVDLSGASYPLWLLLGEAESKCEHISGVPLKPEVAQKLMAVYLSKGVHATTSIEGNTLTVEQVQQEIEGLLKLPRSQSYLGQEVKNILKACEEIDRQLLRGRRVEITPERIQGFNKLVLRDLEVDDHVVPGEYRRVSVGVLGYRGAPWQDCQELVEELCRWLNGPVFQPPTPELTFAYTLLKAVMAHLYIAWIHPFGDGNGRTARLIEFEILLQSGLVPLPTCHLLSNHYNKTRDRYYAMLDRSSKPGGVEPFLRYAVEGLVDGLREQLAEIRMQQWEVAWRDFVHELFRGEESTAKTRRRHLALDMPRTPTPKADLSSISTRIARHYANLDKRTMARDLEALLGMRLIRRVDDGYLPNLDLILAFLPLRFRETGAGRSESSPVP